ncbi:hypothetical protein BJX62DRAFT_245627 [Aspergillus germanicus]
METKADAATKAEAETVEDVSLQESAHTWPSTKKSLIFLTLCLTAFASTTTILANASGLLVQAQEYEMHAEYLSYTLSATLGGSAIGPFIWEIFSRKFGKAATIFTASNMLWIFNIWSAVCRGSNAYGSFIASRTLWPYHHGAVLDQQEGKCIWDLELWSNAWVSLFPQQWQLQPELIVRDLAQWPVQFWYNVGLNALITLFVFVFLEETGPSSTGLYVNPKTESWASRRLYLIPGFKSHRYTYSTSQFVDTLTVPWLILVSPHALIACFALLVYFGFAAGVNNVLAVLLQTPVAHGGYGLNAKQNSNFLFAQWVGVFLALAYGAAYGDRLPLLLARRNNGRWKPEFRLIALFLPCLVFFPIGYVVTGCALARHWNLPTIGFASALIAGSTVLVISSLVAYLTETFQRHQSEANIMTNLARLGWGIALPFAIFRWEEQLGLEWMFGMMAIFHWVCFVPVLVLFFKGDALRALALGAVRTEPSEAEADVPAFGGH